MSLLSNFIGSSRQSILYLCPSLFKVGVIIANVYLVMFVIKS